MSDLEQIFPYKARVLRIQERDRQAELLSLAKDRGAFDPAIFDERTPFFWSAEISNDLVDFYYTHMLESTLQNFANDARAGVSFLNSHRHWELPFGRSLDGTVDRGLAKLRTVADFFTLPGLTLNGISTDDFIAGVRSGIVSDVSVGFYGGKHYCDICKMNYLRYGDCPHFAGQPYETQDGVVVCTVSIDEARLSEVSAVYDGATPDATILKAQRMAEAGELEPKTAQALEARYRIRLPVKRSFAGAEVKKESSMNFEQIVNQLREILALGQDDDIPAAVKELADEAQSLRGGQSDHDAALKRAKEAEAKVETLNGRIAELEATVNELKPQAEEGRQYRTDLIEAALAEGVRAFGEFDAEAYGDVLRGASLDFIKRAKADWQSLGDERFAGGRKSTDDAEAPEKAEQRRAVLPDGSYKV